MYFDELNNYFDDDNYTINTINFSRSNSLYTVEEGFNKGNMFDNLYSKYKNHVYKLKTIDQKDNLLYKVQMYTFALKDLNLYLDTHPTDQNILVEYQKIKRQLEEAKKEYERNYGVICSSDVTSNDKWTWINNPWPWDKGVK